MAGRTSQLQIRVSPEQKAKLKRLAAAAGQNVSEYVLSRALPMEGEELTRALDRVRTGVASDAALAAVSRALTAIEPEGWSACLEGWTPAGLSPSAQNRVAALVEWVARERGLDAPSWTADVPSLSRPHFRWPLASLRPYQTRVVPVAYKRRNLFDPGLPKVGPTGVRATGPLDDLALHLLSLESEVEFYFLGGAVLWQAFAAAGRSARPQDVFAPHPDPVASFLTARGLSRAWLSDELQTPSGWLDRAPVAAFPPPAEYALAMKLACLPATPTGADQDDVRFLLRSLNVADWEGARRSVAHYVSDRYLPPQAKETVERLLA